MVKDKMIKKWILRYRSLHGHFLFIFCYFGIWHGEPNDSGCFITSVAFHFPSSLLLLLFLLLLLPLLLLFDFYFLCFVFCYSAKSCGHCYICWIDAYVWWSNHWQQKCRLFFFLMAKYLAWMYLKGKMETHVFFYMASWQLQKSLFVQFLAVCPCKKPGHILS